MNGATQLKLMTLTENSRKLNTFVSASDKGVHACRLHDGHMRRNAGTIDQAEVLRAGAENHRLTVLTLNRAGQVKSQTIV
jgi:hypothetical protein